MHFVVFPVIHMIESLSSTFSYNVNVNVFGEKLGIRNIICQFFHLRKWLLKSHETFLLYVNEAISQRRSNTYEKRGLPKKRKAKNF